LGQGYAFQWTLITDNWPVFLAGVWIDIWVSLIGFFLACVMGLAVALIRLSGNRWLAVPGFAIVQVARGIPPYVMLLWVHFGLATLLGINFTPIQSIIIVLAFTSGGYTAEIFRSGIAAIQHGQLEAARSLGLSTISAYADVILPQAFRIVVPPLGSVMIGTLKSATLMGAIALPDLLYLAQDLNAAYFAPFEAFTAVMIIFVGVVLLLSLIILGIERSLAHP
jgi:His/Glu/Gln/Arg/opine family amino acid ABC transporter permease subunit